ncbi:MAG: hypothetical protein JWO36_2404 [Myxococcales bacterium]|nr:hypothetical protein [Myxococcales bacterium]
MNRLDTIATHQRKSRVLDAAFATLLVIAGAVSIGSVKAAAHAANTTQLAHR